jgi:hypothetical protein
MRPCEKNRRRAIFALTERLLNEALRIVEATATNANLEVGEAWGQAIRDGTLPPVVYEYTTTRFSADKLTRNLRVLDPRVNPFFLGQTEEDTRVVHDSLEAEVQTGDTPDTVRTFELPQLEHKDLKYCYIPMPRQAGEEVFSLWATGADPETRAQMALRVTNAVRQWQQRSGPQPAAQPQG